MCFACTSTFFHVGIISIAIANFSAFTGDWNHSDLGGRDRANSYGQTCA
ncbi:MAG: hypothetical protein AB1597_06975 [Chloroflexota bacterium]